MLFFSSLHSHGVDMHATDLVGINGITKVLLVYTCQQGTYPRGHVLPLRLPHSATLAKSLRTLGPMNTLPSESEGNINTQ
jgi:hypothetical protein